MPCKQRNGEEVKMRAATKFMQDFFENKETEGCEIGVDIGNHALELLKELNLKRLFLVDNYQRHKKYSPHFEAYGIARERIAEFKDKVKWILWDSVTASNNVGKDSLDFVYIDGDHSYAWCLADCRLWWPKIKEGGILCGHDYVIGAVKDATKEFSKEKNLLLEDDKTGSSMDWWIIKKGELG